MPRLVVGLGNPGPEYARSPHNVGFLVVDRFSERGGIVIHRKECRALVGSGTVGGVEVMVAKPQTYMNLSGTAVKPLLEKYGIEPADLIVVYDDHDLPWESVRVRMRGSAGGHHGMESIIRSIGTSDFVRVRVGINPGAAKADPEFLLKPMRREQAKELDALLDYTSEAVESIITEGVEKAMTRFNRRALGKEEE